MPLRPADSVDEPADDAVAPAVQPDQRDMDIAAAATDFLQQLAHLTGRGVIPGVPEMPKFTVKFPTAAERADRRAQRRRHEAGGDGGCTAADQLAD